MEIFSIISGRIYEENFGEISVRILNFCRNHWKNFWWNPRKNYREAIFEEIRGFSKGIHAISESIHERLCNIDLREISEGISGGNSDIITWRFSETRIEQFSKGISEKKI